MKISVKSPLSDVYPLQNADIPIAIQVITRAFMNDPGICMSFPDASTRYEKTSYLWEMLIRDRLKYGEIYAPSSKIEGVAIWLPSKNWEMGLFRSLKALSLRKLLGLVTIARSGMVVGNAMDKAHKAVISTPHMYLTTLAVDPSHQGKKFASVLLRPMLARCDSEKVPIYLETATEFDVQLYLHFGFEVMREFRVGDSDLFMKSMLYKPQ